MALTPSDVEQKTFSTALRGYDLDEVDDFLDEVVSTLRDLHEQVADAKAAQPSTEAPVVPVAAAAAEPPPVDSESAVGRVLITAQTTADTIVAEAKDEANTIVEDAKAEAESWSTARDAKKAEADAEMSELSNHVAGVRTQLAILATAVADRLDEMDIAISGDSEDEAEDVDVGDESTDYDSEDTDDSDDEISVDSPDEGEGDADDGHGDEDADEDNSYPY